MAEEGRAISWGSAEVTNISHSTEDSTVKTTTEPWKKSPWLFGAIGDATQFYGDDNYPLIIRSNFKIFKHLK